MPLVPVPLGPSSDSANTKQGGGAMLTNCFVEKTDGGKTGFTINTDPGLKFIATIEADKPCRGGVILGNNIYAIFGETAYKIYSSGYATALGAVAGTQICTFSVNRKTPYQQITVTADAANAIIENDVLSAVSDPDLPGSVHSNAYLNGRTIYGLRDGRFFISALNNSASVSALDFAEAERSSDPGVRVFAIGEELWYFGTESLEIYHTTGATFPFAPLQGAGQGAGAGCGAKNTVAMCNRAIFWVNDEKRVVRADGYTPVPVSNHAVERSIQEAFAAEIQDSIVASSWSTEGHNYYHLRCPLWTWVYDATYEVWHRKTDYLGNSWQGAFQFSIWGKNIVLGADDGCMYEYTFDCPTDAGKPLMSKIRTSPLNAFPEGYICNALHLDVQSGVGRAEGDPHVQDPQILLRVSRDGGMTFGTEYRRSVGRQGNYDTQVRYNRLGAAKGAGMVFELSMPEPVERAVFQATADLTRLSA